MHAVQNVKATGLLRSPYPHTNTSNTTLVALRHYRFVVILLVYGACGTVLYHRAQKEGNVTQTQSKKGTTSIDGL